VLEAAVPFLSPAALSFRPSIDRIKPRPIGPAASHFLTRFQCRGVVSALLMSRGPPGRCESAFILSGGSRGKRPRLCVPAARNARGFVSAIALELRGRRECRMLAAPAGPCVQRRMHFAHASNDRAAGTAGIPCAMVLRLIRDLPGVPCSLATVALRIARKT
jgi:hypothetical protein